MRVINYQDVEAREVRDKGARGVKMRWLITHREGAKNFVMRIFEVEPQGFTPFHSHPWEHEVFILNGVGKLIAQKGEEPLKAGDAAFVQAEEEHQFKNTGKELLRFVCLIPMLGMREMER